MKALRESRGIALFCFWPWHYKGVRGQRHAPAAHYPRKDPVPIVQEAGWTSGPVWTGTENLAPTGIRSPDCPAHRQSLYRLRYSAHVSGELWTWEIPGSEDHRASHATTNCCQVILIVTVQVMELQISPVSSSCSFPMQTLWPTSCLGQHLAKRMAGTSDGNIAKYTGEECVNRQSKIQASSHGLRY